MRAVRVSIEALFADAPPPAPGSYCFDGNRSMSYTCPGCGELRSLPVERGPKRPGAWQWDGSEDAPTISPSIRQLDGCRWHGFLELGEWRACEDGPPNADGRR